MLYPKGETVHQNLSSEYTDLPQLLSTLQANAFAGIVAVETTDRKGAFFLTSGSIVNAVVEYEENTAPLVGEEAVEELLVLSTKPGGLLHVYRLTPKEVEFSASTLKSESLFTGLSTDFVRLERFIGKLAAEKLTGYIELFSKEGSRLGVLFMRDGEEEGLQVTAEGESPSFFEKTDIPSFLEGVIARGAVFNVFRCLALPIPQRKEAAAQKRSAAGMVAEAAAAGEEEQVSTGKVVMLLEKQRSEGPPEKGRNELITALQELFGKIQRFSDGASQKGGFQRAFKRACVEKSEAYPFLDPFEGLFDYDGGRIKLDNEVGTEDFAAGIADCLNLALLHLQRELPKQVALPQELKGEIESSFEDYQDAVKGSGLQSVVPATLR
jgi:hypothetical protein